MNIAIVLMKYNPFGGYERQAVLLARALGHRGDRVTVFASDWKGEKDSSNITFRKVPVTRFASWLKVLTFARASRRMLEAERGGFDVVIGFDRTLVMDIYRAGNACHREWQAFRREFGSLGDQISMVLNPLHGVINSIEKRVFASMQRRRGPVVVLSAEGMRQIRRHYDIDEACFEVIPPAVALGRIGPLPDVAVRQEAREGFGLGQGTMALLHVGSGFSIKGLRSTIEALAVLEAKGIDAVLLVAGKDRRGTKRLGRVASHLGISGRVRFLGGVTDVARLYAASDLFVLPSLFETFGVAVVEALASGLPVVVGRGAGAAGFVEENRVGRTIEVPADAEKLAELIEDSLVAELELCRTGGIDAERRRRRTVAEKCSEAVVMERYLKLIDRIGSKRRKNG